MSDTVGIVVATFGDVSWIDRAKTAVFSAEHQITPATRVIHHHAQNLAQARNEGAYTISTDWLIFLDADDSLDSRYVKEMLSDVDSHTLRQPSTLGVYPDGSEDEFPVLIPERPLTESNYLVIGTMCRREMFLDVGGFDPEFPVLEDWDLWLRMTRAGATIGKRPDAIYRVGVNENSRNQNANLHGQYYSRIRTKYA